MRACNGIAKRLVLAAFSLTVLAAAAIAQGQTPTVKHPVLPHKIDPKSAAGLERTLRPLMAMSEEEMLRLVPGRSGIIFCGCPNCSGGQQENGILEWNIERPFQLRCRFCRHEYPSDKYPMRWTASGVNGLGETVTYRYYFDEKTGRDYWFEAYADYYRRAWFVGRCLMLATCYHVTDKPEYARRAAIILDHFAQAYPHMAVLYQWPYRRRAVVKPSPPYPNAGGKWGRWMESEVPALLPEAYDLIHDSPELDKLSQQKGIDVRRRIEDDFFRATVQYAFTFGKEPKGFHLNNMAPFYTRNIIQLGRILGEPSYVHWGQGWLNNILHDRFFSDGMWCESPSYHAQTISGVRTVLAALTDNGDPPGSRGGEGGSRLEKFDAARFAPVVEKARHAPDQIAYPDGRVCPVHDTWARARVIAPRQDTVSALLPGFGHAVLGRGSAANQTQVHLHFSGSYGHAHADNLNLSLFAKGGEMFSDLGYTHTKLRGWTTSTVAHNTVVIDRRGQAGQDTDGDLLMFVPHAAGIAAVEASGERAYPRLASRYRRLAVLVPISEADGYVVDVFRVQGGGCHDWLLHGSAEEDMQTECSLAAEATRDTLLEPDQKWVEPVGESSSVLPYGLIRAVAGARTEGDLRVTMRYTASSGPAAGAGVRVHVLGGSASEVFWGKSPRVRQAEGNDRKVYDFWMPQLVVRRQGTTPLDSVFVAVHEPFRTTAPLRAVRRLSLSPAGDGAVAMEVQHGDFVDTIVSTRDEPPYVQRRLPDGSTFQGRLAVLRRRAGQVTAAWLIDGLSLAAGDFLLKPKAPRYEGTIESATRVASGAVANTFVTTADLPQGAELAGQWMIVTHGNGHTHGYAIHHVERTGQKTSIFLNDDHGLRITGDETEECYFPRRTMRGPNRFVIVGQARFPSH